MHLATLDHPACADPIHLPLVDEAFRRPGGEAAERMRKTLCRHCPSAQQCFNEAMANKEEGFWAGTSPTGRTLARKRRHARASA